MEAPLYLLLKAPPPGCVRGDEEVKRILSRTAWEIATISAGCRFLVSVDLQIKGRGSQPEGILHVEALFR